MPTVTPDALEDDSSHNERSLLKIQSEEYINQQACMTRPVRINSRPLRIVRILDHDGSSPNHVGRMMISGRMADVCAELDRLVAREQTLHSH